MLRAPSLLVAYIDRTYEVNYKLKKKLYIGWCREWPRVHTLIFIGALRWPTELCSKTPQDDAPDRFDVFILSSAHVVLFDLNCYDLLYGNTGQSIKQWVWDNSCLISPSSIDLHAHGFRVGAQKCLY